MRKKRTNPLVILAVVAIAILIIYMIVSFVKKKRAANSESAPTAAKASIIGNTSPGSRWTPAMAAPDTTVIARTPNSYGAGNTRQVVTAVPIF